MRALHGRSQFSQRCLEYGKYSCRSKITGTSGQVCDSRARCLLHLGMTKIFWARELPGSRLVLTKMGKKEDKDTRCAVKPARRDWDLV